MNEQAPLPDPTPVHDRYSSDELFDMNRRLVHGAHMALLQTTFAGRVEVMAQVTGDIAGQLAAESLGAAESEGSPLVPVFREAARRAGQAFEPVFDQNGYKRATVDEAVYARAVDATGAIALDLLPEAAAAVNVTGVEAVDGAKLMGERATLEDALSLADKMLDIGPDESGGALTADRAKELFAELLKDDSFKDRLGDIRFRSEMADQTEPTSAEQVVFESAVRLAQAAWLAGQPQKAAYEGNTDRIDPTKKSSFTTYESMAQTLYGQTFDAATEAGLDETEARVRARYHVALEIYKDVLHVSDAAAERLASTA